MLHWKVDAGSEEANSNFAFFFRFRVLTFRFGPLVIEVSGGEESGGRRPRRSESFTFSRPPVVTGRPLGSTPSSSRARNLARDSLGYRARISAAAPAVRLTMSAPMLRA